MVLATTRHAFVDGRQKAVFDLSELGPMESERLREIYNLRISAFHDGVSVFDRDALDLLVESAQGMVGIFLRNCYEVQRHAGLLRDAPARARRDRRLCAVEARRVE